MTAAMRLFHGAGACSEVTLAALRRIGLPFAIEIVDLAAGEQRSPAYLAINPHGKVPALLVEGTLLVENPAILLYLHTLRSGAGLLPSGADPLVHARAVSDLVWCSATLHPIVRAVRMPSRLTDGDAAGVRAKGIQLLRPIAERCEARLAAQPFWFGDSWSVVDVYVDWAFGLAAAGDFALEAYPTLDRRVKARG